MLPDWVKQIHASERSQRLYPFAPSGQLTDVKCAYTYPKDYGSKPNSVGWIGDAALAGTTDTSYGVILYPDQDLYMLSDADIALLLRWFPGGWNVTKLRGILLTEFNRNVAELPSLDWPNILAILTSRNPPYDEEISRIIEERVTPVALYDEVRMSPAAIANSFGVDLKALQKRLERFRMKNDKGWFEVADAGPRDAKYLYRVGSIRHLINSSCPSSERPAKI
jgi:hypothetical protein